MSVLLGSLVCVAFLVQGSPELSGPLAPLSVRLKLRTATSEIAETGRHELVERMAAVLAALGDEARELERLARGWEKSSAKAKPTRSTHATAAGRLRRELGPLVGQLAVCDESRRSALARCILEVDSEQEQANAVVGRERDGDGEWLTGEERAWKLDAIRQAGLLVSAGALEFEVEHGKSANPALLKLCGSGNLVRSHGIELHARLAPEKLERILGQALRACCLSNALLRGRLGLPGELRPEKFVLLDTDEQVGPAIAEALEAKSIAPEDYEALGRLGLRSFLDSRGWRTSRWRNEAEFEAMILWECLGSWLGKAQPCLRVGHLNWVCLSFLGSSMPSIAWSEQAAGGGPAEYTVAKRDDELQRQFLWRSARQSLLGCRAWMVREVRAQRDPPWARAMLDQDGLIRDENLLKTTLVCELLQAEERLWELIQATVEKTPPSAAVEKALGEPLPDFEARWRRWLDPPRRAGVLQELERGAPEPEGSPHGAALLALNEARGSALKDQMPEIPVVALDPELCRAAELHARYLTLNPAQKAVWPAAHEEYVGSPGFTPAGSLSGARSVIDFDGDPVRAIESWLGTFFHRLHLLDPGLFGVGFGRSEDVVVLDVRSLVLAPWQDHVVVWPPPGAEDVPRAFVPELPNPVPGAEIAELGHPVTVQLYFHDPTGRATLELELFLGDPERRSPVDCHAIAPEAPLQKELAPENAWCLIPKTVLAKKTRYTARARWLDQVKVWSFTTGN